MTLLAWLRKIRYKKCDHKWVRVWDYDYCYRCGKKV